MILKLFIFDGKADVEALVGEDQSGPEMTALEIMEMLIASYGIKELFDIRGHIIDRIKALNQRR